MYHSLFIRLGTSVLLKLARVITTPLLLLDLFLTAGLPWPTILYTILIDEIMIVTGLIGALVQSSYKVSKANPSRCQREADFS